MSLGIEPPSPPDAAAARRLGLHATVVDETARRRAVDHLRERGIRLPTFAELAAPETIPGDLQESLRSVDPDAPDGRNLFRVHWHNAADRRGRTDVPAHVVLPRELTGVAAPIVVLLGDRFPLITAHKVLAAYGCLAPRLVTGRFDPTRQRAVWPSTGNYCRGGVAISRILGCHGVAVLPEGMSRERFRWLERWVASPRDIVRTPGSESNVKEIYDACAELAADPDHVVLNQFAEFGNHLAHWRCTGPAFSRVFEALAAERDDLELWGFVAASGSAGTLGAGDHLEERHGARIVVAEALECPTLLENGFGEHNIQGIGDKHVPLIHNVMNTDVVVGVSDRSTDWLNVLFNSDAGRAWLTGVVGLDRDALDALSHLGLSSICNVLAAIKVARAFGLEDNDVLMTVATDGADLYRTEIDKVVDRDFPEGFDRFESEMVFEEHLAGLSADHVLELRPRDRRRIFNLGYFTWVEQQGVEVSDFRARADPAFWSAMRGLPDAWDELITAFNRDAGTA